jgi:hypothetical protein
MDIYAIECGLLPWISRRKAADALRAQKESHVLAYDQLVQYAYNVQELARLRHAKIVDNLTLEIKQLRAQNEQLNAGPAE